MQESCTYGSVRGAPSNGCPYRNPGIIKTPMNPLEAHQFLALLHPMGRMGEVSDVVDAVTYLDSAGFVTGEILHVDGGQAAGHHTI
jgi:NAD(P)-dependent dehydrogenase (short-subunit alcohol dehydrogenase family)